MIIILCNGTWSVRKCVTRCIKQFSPEGLIFFFFFLEEKLRHKPAFCMDLFPVGFLKRHFNRDQKVNRKVDLGRGDIFEFENLWHVLPTPHKFFIFALDILSQSMSRFEN